MPARITGLTALARMYDIQPAYVNIAGERRTASPDALLQTLRSLGADVESAADVRAALAAERVSRWRRMADPVVVAWDGKAPAIEIRRQARGADRRVYCKLSLEDGTVRVWDAAPGPAALRRERIGGEEYVAHRIDIDGPLPHGYHHFSAECGNAHAEQVIVAAPVRGYTAPGESREWGIFLPLYALRTRNSLGIGDFSDLQTLALWLAERGGTTVATLPLLAAFLDKPYDASPYSPVSRLFWNECFLDPRSVPGVAGNNAARAILEAAAREGERRGPDVASEVDYASAWKLRRRILDPVAHAFFDAGGADSPEFRTFIQKNPRAPEYAWFRSRCERFGAGWPGWAEEQQYVASDVAELDGTARFHLFAQMATSAQLEAVADRVESAGGRFYLDLPLGVRGDGYDVWRDRDLFALDASAGAPPDPFFSKGQAWGFPPLRPRALRDTAYAYFRDCIRTHMRYAGVLRLDHVMGLHRLYWVPQGASAADGVYVHYDAEVQYAILALESHRHETVLVGEDLGTVPREVRHGMARHGLRRMSVLQYEVSADRQPPLARPGPRQVASINTHDMPTFAAFWAGTDVVDRQDLGLLDDAEAAEVRRERARLRQALTGFLQDRGLLDTPEAEPADVHAAALRFYGGSPARLVLANLEDLWGETRPHNTPGTFMERPNWRRRAAYAFEEFCAMPKVTEVLRSLNAARGREEVQ